MKSSLCESSAILISNSSHPGGPARALGKYKRVFIVFLPKTAKAAADEFVRSWRHDVKKRNAAGEGDYSVTRKGGSALRRRAHAKDGVGGTEVPLQFRTSCGFLKRHG